MALPTQRTIVLELDGTVSDSRDRDHFIARERKDWVSFFKHCHEDPPRRNVIGFIKRLLEQWDATLIVLSRRPQHVLEKTRQWLQKVGLVPSEIHLKPPSQMRRVTWKVEMFKWIASRTCVLAFIESDPQVFFWLESSRPRPYFLIPTTQSRTGLAVWAQPQDPVTTPPQGVQPQGGRPASFPSQSQSQGLLSGSLSRDAQTQQSPFRGTLERNRLDASQALDLLSGAAPLAERAPQGQDSFGWGSPQGQDPYRDSWRDSSRDSWRDGRRAFSAEENTLGEGGPLKGEGRDLFGVPWGDAVLRDAVLSNVVLREVQEPVSFSLHDPTEERKRLLETEAETTPSSKRPAILNQEEPLPLDTGEDSVPLDSGPLDTALDRLDTDPSLDTGEDGGEDSEEDWAWDSDLFVGIKRDRMRRIRRQRVPVVFGRVLEIPQSREDDQVLLGTRVLGSRVPDDALLVWTEGDILHLARPQKTAHHPFFLTQWIRPTSTREDCLGGDPLSQGGDRGAPHRGVLRRPTLADLVRDSRLVFDSDVSPLSNRGIETILRQARLGVLSFYFLTRTRGVGLVLTTPRQVPPWQFPVQDPRTVFVSTGWFFSTRARREREDPLSLPLIFSQDEYLIRCFFETVEGDEQLIFHGTPFGLEASPRVSTVLSLKKRQQGFFGQALFGQADFDLEIRSPDPLVFSGGDPYAMEMTGSVFETGLESPRLVVAESRDHAVLVREASTQSTAETTS